MDTLKIKPRDLRVGDLMPKMQPDLSVADVPVVSIEPVRPHGVTVYKTRLEGEPEPMFLQPSQVLTVKREQ